MSTRSLVILAMLSLPGLAPACHTEKSGEPTPAAAALESAPPPPPTQPSQPAGPLPDESPRFTWKPPLSVPIEESGSLKGRKVVSRYWLDVCPTKDGNLQLSRRDLQLISVNGRPAPQKLTEIVDDGGAEGVSDMTVDHAGRFVYTNPTIDWRLGNLWEGWVGIWLQIDPKGGNPQEVATQEIGNGARTLISYRGKVGDHFAFEAHRDLNKDEVWQMTKEQMIRSGLQDYQVAKLTRSAQQTLNVETDWPELRPWFAHARRTIVFASAGDEKQFVEEREYRFDWNASKKEKAKCP
jgi:hypothetical protein